MCSLFFLEIRDTPNGGIFFPFSQILKTAGVNLGELG